VLSTSYPAYCVCTCPLHDYKSIVMLQAQCTYVSWFLDYNNYYSTCVVFNQSVN